MCGVFDLEDGDFLMKMSDDMLMDSEGNLMQRVGDNMALDLDSGELHLTSGSSPDLLENEE